MAHDAGFDAVVPYAKVTLEEIHGLVQDIIFPRSPMDLRRSAILVGGRDAGIAMDMVDAAKAAMVPPFEVSILADPSGAFTTAAAIVACVEKQLLQKHQMELKDARVVIFGGTGPIGVATGVITSLAGAAATIVDYLSIDTALSKAAEYNRRCGTSLRGAYGCSDADNARLVSRHDVVICTAKAGVQVLNASVLEDARRLKVAADINATPPAGIEGIQAKDNGTPTLHAAVCDRSRQRRPADDRQGQGENPADTAPFDARHRERRSISISGRRSAPPANSRKQLITNHEGHEDTKISLYKHSFVCFVTFVVS